MESNKTLLNEYNYRIVEIVNKKINDLHINQKQLSELTGISQPTLSKLLSNKSKFTVEQLAKISIALKTDISEFLSFKNVDIDSINDIYSSKLIIENDNLVYDTKRPAFKGYIGNKYDIYFYSTISTETKLIHGELTLTESKNNRCKINLKLYTGKIDVSGDRITKNYNGDMIISIPLSSCYCILTNQSIGEMCFLIFHHMFLFNQDMICRVGAALTTSSGENRRPTLHRMIISKYMFDIENDGQDMHFLRGQLKLNDSQIIISKSSFEKAKKSLFSDNLNEFQDFFAKFENSISKEEFYIIDETQLLASNIPVETKIKGISMLRELSVSNKYNKISTKSDEYLFKYIESRDPQHF